MLCATEYRNGGSVRAGEQLLLLELGRQCFAFVRRESLSGNIPEVVAMAKGVVLNLSKISLPVQEALGVPEQVMAEATEVDSAGIIRLSFERDEVDLYSLGDEVEATVVSVGSPFSGLDRRYDFPFSREVSLFSVGLPYLASPPRLSA